MIGDWERELARILAAMIAADHSDEPDLLDGLTSLAAEVDSRQVAVAVVAHILVWMWRPWRPGPNGYRGSRLDA